MFRNNADAPMTMSNRLSGSGTGAVCAQAAAGSIIKEKAAMFFLVILNSPKGGNRSGGAVTPNSKTSISYPRSHWQFSGDLIRIGSWINSKLG
jgi:hypothetical protein